MEMKLFTCGNLIWLNNMLQQVRKHRHINTAVKGHLNKLSIIKDIDEIHFIINANYQSFMPLAVELMDATGCSQFESVLEEVCAAAEGHNKHHNLGISILLHNS
jgi:hypothetical protein